MGKHTNASTNIEDGRRTISRRGFLASSLAVGAAALAAPTIVPARAFGANERVVLGAIGVGNQGTSLLRVFRGMETHITAIADVNLPRAEEVAEEFGAESAYQDYRKILDRDDIDGVVIATPQHWHALQCIEAAQAGKDIYCEKPLSYTIREGRLVTQAAEKYDCILQTGSQQRSGRQEYRGIMHVRNGSLGKITRIEADNYYSPMEHGHPAEAIPAGLDWRMWCGPAGVQQYNFAVFDNRSNPSWVSIRPFSGGNLADRGTHGLDIAQWGLGMDDSGPVEVWTEGDPMKPFVSTPSDPGGRQRGPGSPKVFMKYGNGVVMEFGDGPNWSGVRFIGENGSMDITRNTVSADPEEILEQPIEELSQQLPSSSNHYRNWLECIKDRRQPIAPAEVGHRTATICHLANIARWVSAVTGVTGEPLKWDPVEEQFSNNDIANKFLHRPGYAPYTLPEKV